MALKPLEVLKNGLKTLRNKVKAKKTKLEMLLAEQKSILSEDEAWLDHEGNLVDLEKVVDKLETASDYERGVERLDEEEKGVVKKLREAAGELAKVIGKKRKRTEPKVKEVTEKASKKKEKEPVFTKKENATLAQQIEILDWYHANGKNQSKTAQHFSPKYPNLKMKQPLVSSWVKEESKWREQWATASKHSDRTAKRA
ncbi:hypothetical protein DXG01_013601 [Tephrocybe rancida]|nr:hypothetical protein DXG01_013601 [Tephrocybe rancida]